MRPAFFAIRTDMPAPLGYLNGESLRASGSTKNAQASMMISLKALNICLVLGSGKVSFQSRTPIVAAAVSAGCARQWPGPALRPPDRSPAPAQRLGLIDRPRCALAPLQANREASGRRSTRFAPRYRFP